MNVSVSIQPKSEYAPYPYKSEVEISIDYYRNKVYIEINKLEVDFTLTFNIEDLRKIVSEHYSKQ